jgi:hypothetical protein
MKWIIENFNKELSYTDIVKEIKNQGMEVKEINHGYKHSDIDEFRSGNHCVMFLGSIEMTELVKKQLPNCYPVAFCTPENYLCSKYMSHFGKYLFNDKYAMMSLSELHRKKFFYYGTFGNEALIFIRPDSGQKPFQAQLLDLLDIDRFVERHDHVKHDLVLVSTPKNIIWEGRFVVTKYKEILGVSTYRFQGQVTKIPSAPGKATELVKELLEVGYYPDPVFCIDIASDADGNYWLLEINSFSSAGLYACKLPLIVKRVSEIAQESITV